MNILTNGAAKRLILSLLLAGSLGGCAYYGPPPATYDPYPYADSWPTYVGPPVSLDLGFGFYDFGRVHHRGQRGHDVYRPHGRVDHGYRGWPGGHPRRR